MLQIYNRIIPSRSEETLIWLTVLIFILFIFLAIIDAIRNMIFVNLSETFESYFSRITFSRSLIVDSQLDNQNQNQSLRDVEQIRTLIAKGHLLHFFDIIWLPAFVCAIALMHPILACMAVLGAIWLCCLAIAGHILSSRSIESGRKIAQRSFAMSQDLIANRQLVTSLGITTQLLARWDKARASTSAQQTKFNDKLALLAAIGKASRFLIQSLTLGIGAYLAINDAVSAGAIVASSILVGRALTPIEATISTWHKLLEAKEAYCRILALIEDMDDDLHQPDLSKDEGRLVVEGLSCIEGNRTLVRNLSFTSEPGTVIAIVGPSSAGKSALIQRLIGLRSPSDGHVRLDGKNPLTLSDKDRHRNIGYLPQEEAFTAGSIVECIGRFGGYSAEEILFAAQITGCHDMILSLPDGYATKIGKDGSQLSAGQKKRLALARAVCGMPNFVALDEPTAHLDETGERSLIRAIDELRQANVTVCVVTHKTSLIRQCDLLVVLNGRGDSCVSRPDEVLSARIHTISMDDKPLVTNQ